ncbi:hypothetical protein [Streptomyces sp. NPDC087512]|uniref:hypothetical protein n=1 Tax=unclassified Streptomyces TaxID=2593676 RepID=UPI003439ED25
MTDDEMTPLPPPFMWACALCVEMLDALTDAYDMAAVDPFHDGAVRAQIALSRHLSVEHPGEVPDPHEDGCWICASYAHIPADALLWSEHRARGLFLPPDTARLM